MVLCVCDQSSVRQGPTNSYVNGRRSEEDKYSPNEKRQREPLVTQRKRQTTVIAFDSEGRVERERCSMERENGKGEGSW